MKTTFQLYSLSLAFLSSAVINCGGPAADDTENFQSLIRVMPMHHPGDVSPAEDRASQAAKTLTNYGGPTLKNVKVIPVYWNASVAYASNLTSFYQSIVTSSIYTSLLPQYGGIGAGSVPKVFTDANSSANVTEAQVVSYLNAQIASGALPTPDANTYYPVHFPPGMTVTDSGGTASCVTWCAFHGTAARSGGSNLNYGIIPDQGGGCAGGCGANAQRVNNLTSVSSHELVEATTDPAVGLATTYAPPLAWYNRTYGEIGDICNAQQATVGGYVVQKEWSNKSNSCNTL